MSKQLVKLVEVKSLKRYPYQGRYHFNINKVVDNENLDMYVQLDYFTVEHVRRDGALAVWQPKPLKGNFETLEQAEDAVTKWAKKPLLWTLDKGMVFNAYNG